MIRFFLLGTAIVMALTLSVPQPAEAFVASKTASEANIAAQAEISDVTEVRRRHRHRHRHHHHSWLWAAPFVAAPFLFAPHCERYWSRRYGWVERCW